MAAMIPAQLSDAQRAFVQAAESAGATTPAGARPLSSLPRLAARDLDELVDRGLVRESAERTYYVFHPRWTGQDVPAADVSMPARPRWNRGRAVRAVLFWLFVILVPILFLQLSSGQ